MLRSILTSSISMQDPTFTELPSFTQLPLCADLDPGLLGQRGRKGAGCV